jgi:hypothetical protein
MPAGRPRNPAGAGERAPVLSLRLDAMTEAALGLVRGQLTAGRAVQAMLRAEALRLAGPERLRRATDAIIRRRRRAV